MSAIDIRQILNKDRERLPISKRLRQLGGLEIKPLEVDGYKFPMHTTYLFDRKKVYTKENTRGLTGQVHFSEKLFVPYFTVTYNILPLQEYSAMMQLLEKDEVTVCYYDTFDNQYKTDKFYAQQPESSAMQPYLYEADDDTKSVGILDKIISHEMRYGFMQNTTIIFAGTKNDVSQYNINFSANGATGSAPITLNLYEGEEFVVPSPTNLYYTGKVFNGWNTERDGTGTNYAVGSVVVATSSFTLYANWKNSDVFTMNLVYGFDKVMVGGNSNNEVPANINVTYNTAISGLPTSIDVLTTDKQTNKDVVLIDKEGNKVYTFVHWNKLPSGVGTTLSNGSIYDIKGPSSAYAIFSARSYNINFYKFENAVGGTTWATISGEYGTKFAVNKPTENNRTFAGWYTKNANGEEVRFTASTIPAGNYNVYAKWNEG